MNEELKEAADNACKVLETLYFQYQLKIGPYASQAHDAAMKLRAALTHSAGDKGV